MRKGLSSHRHFPACLLASSLCVAALSYDEGLTCLPPVRCVFTQYATNTTLTEKQRGEHQRQTEAAVPPL